MSCTQNFLVQESEFSSFVFNTSFNSTTAMTDGSDPSLDFFSEEFDPVKVNTMKAWLTQEFERDLQYTIIGLSPLY